ncbi:MAG: SDR family oxidoreductase [Candidatus Heimdallarchaeota archaeon]|nr:SDR family oxidoreductase [Candidatus Heimdallarchaeota archaeon]
MNNKFENKVVLITGGGTGIGKATAEAFVGEGGKVVIVGRRQNVVQATTKELGDKAQFVIGDISKVGEPKIIIDQVIAKNGQLDLLVNNAAAFTRGPLSETTDEEIERIYRTNVFALLALSREALPHLIKTKGSIINISSGAANTARAGGSIYASSKAAVNALTRNLAAEFGPSGVRVNVISPGVTVTEMSAPMTSNEEMMTRIVKQTALGRIGLPSDIAKAILLIASDEAGWITGQIVQASGGLTL